MGWGLWSLRRWSCGKALSVVSTIRAKGRSLAPLPQKTSGPSALRPETPSLPLMGERWRGGPQPQHLQQQGLIPHLPGPDLKSLGCRAHWGSWLPSPAAPGARGGRGLLGNLEGVLEIGPHPLSFHRRNRAHRGQRTCLGHTVSPAAGLKAQRSPPPHP